MSVIYNISAMHKIILDRDRKLLHLAYWGQVGVQDGRSSRETIERFVEEMEPGYRVLTDLAGLESMDFECTGEIKGIMDACQRAQVSKVVRLIPKPEQDIGFSIMSAFHYDSNVAIRTCERVSDVIEELF